MTDFKAEKVRWSADQEGTWISFLIGNQAAARNYAESVERPQRVSVKEWREKRSLDANAYFHLLVGKIAAEMNLGFEEVKTNLVVEYGAVARDAEGVKVGFKLPESVDVSQIYRYVKRFDTRVENGKTFACYIVFKHTHTLDSKEMSRLIDGAIYEAKNLGIETATPEELARMKEEWK